MIKEFRDFIAKGNVMDMAVGIISGGTDFSGNYVVLNGVDLPPGTSLNAARDAGANVFAWGAFMSAVINFFIIAFVVFLLVKTVNQVKETAMHSQKAEEAAAGPSQEELLAQIRDLLAEQGNRG